jgi:RNA polymerase sigma factor (sigma-70 family)
MPFPETRQTLIQRLANSGDETDWRQFMLDYWGPICRFASSRSGIPVTDAEDVASLTFEALLANQLLARWVLKRNAKLRTLLCTVVRNILSNRIRVDQGRARLIREQMESGSLPLSFQTIDAAEDQIDAFYAAWVNDLLEQVVQSIWQEYHASGRGDYFRVLHGKICEDMSLPEIAQALELPLTSAENYYKAARKQFAKKLEELIRQHTSRYCENEQLEDEFQAEWHKLGEHLTTHGGLEQIVRRTMSEKIDAGKLKRKCASVEQTLQRHYAPNE